MHSRAESVFEGIRYYRLRKHWCLQIGRVRIGNVCGLLVGIEIVCWRTWIRLSPSTPKIRLW